MIEGRLFTLGSKYEGAMVSLMKAGYFPRISKVDFISQYPSAIRTWNLGPDTTRITNVFPYTGKYKFTRTPNTLQLMIPDANFQKDIEVTVDMTKTGFLKAEIERLTIERNRLKKLKSEAKTATLTTTYDSQQLAIKIILNSIYGYLGNKFATFGDMAGALTVTGMCRWTTMIAVGMAGDSLIELDSVTGDTPIYVKNDDEIDIIPIRDLHTNGKRASYTGKWKVLTRSGWSEIRYTKCHDVRKPIHRVKISDGYVDVTGDHSLFEHGTQKAILSRNIKVYSTEIETGSMPNRLRPSIPSSILRPGENPMRIPEFNWLLGFITAEGSVTSSRTGKQQVLKSQISVNGQNFVQMQKVRELCNRYLGFTGSRFGLYDTIKSSGVYKVEGGYNTTTCRYLFDLCYCKDRKTKKVPRHILNYPIELAPAYLQGLMDGDGYIAVNQGRRCESIDSKFKTLAAGIRYLRNQLGNETCICIRKDKRNITTIRKRFKPKHYKNLKRINRNIVTQNEIITKKAVVYDISTGDGTFVTALGDIVLHNTDGMIVEGSIDYEEINKKITKEVEEQHGCKSYMELEEEKLLDAYFYKMKNYVVRMQKKGKVVMEKHGCAFKSSKAAPIYDIVMEKLCTKTLDREIGSQYEDAEKMKKLSQYGKTDFKLRVTFSKDLAAYGDRMSLQRVLGTQVEHRLKQKVEKGMQVEYYVTKEPPDCPPLLKIYNDAGRKKGPYYTISQYVDSRDQLDTEYYTDQMNKLFEIFAWKSSPQLELNI